MSTRNNGQHLTTTTRTQNQKIITQLRRPTDIFTFYLRVESLAKCTFSVTLLAVTLSLSITAHFPTKVYTGKFVKLTGSQTD